ncbi:MAG: hypothetical protein AAB581_02355 [Patescibacteria group bacterium]
MEYFLNVGALLQHTPPGRCRRGRFFFMCVALIFFFGWGGASVHAQDDVIVSEQKQTLRGQLKEIEQQINEYQESIATTKQEQKSLNQEIGVLDKQVKKQQLQIREIDLSLADVEDDIRTKTAEIDSLEGQLAERRQLLLASVRRLNEYDGTSAVSLFLRSESISVFFSQMRYLKNIQNNINQFIANIDDIRTNLEEQKTDLEGKRSDIVRLRGLSGLQKTALEQKQKEKQTLLVQTKGQQKLYEAGIKKSQKDITLIKQQLFVLESVGISMSFEEALAKAKFSGEKTGVRPAFLLAIFQVESKLGTYIGGGSWKVDMKPQERQSFLVVTGKLGLDPDTTPVSKRPSYGWGGAMGAAQFLPSTWLAYEEQIASLTGNNPPSPWNIEDAFMGSAIKLVSNGAGTRAYKDEHKAAAMYLGGSNYKKSVAQAYANNVMDWAEYYQGQIDAISVTNGTRS